VKRLDGPGWATRKKDMIYSFSHQIQSNDKMEFEILVRAAQQQSPSGFLASSPICFTKVTALHPHFARARSRLAREACRWEVGMPAGTKRGYALILTSTTFVAFGAALFICWAAGAFDAPLAKQPGSRSPSCSGSAGSSAACW
jgi:hypothetical protein